MSSKEAVLAVRAALELLPPGSRTVISLRHIEGLPVVEVAERMQRTPNAVKALLARSRSLLREHIGSAAAFFTDAPSTRL